MSTPVTIENCDCGCIAAESGSIHEPPCDCSLKMALTYEEEAILEKLRNIKTKVRPIAQTLKEIEFRLSDRTGEDSSGVEGEWTRLSDELSELRSAWHEWESRLEDAIERKWIILGHREPRK